MQIDVVLRAFGGTARWGKIGRQVNRRALESAVAAGHVLRDLGTYSLPPTPYATRQARRLNGIRSHRSAAEHWGLAMFRPEWVLEQILDTVACAAESGLST